MVIGAAPLEFAMGVGEEWKPRYRVTAALVIAKDQVGRLHHCYRNSRIAWLNDQQRQHFLNKGLVELIDEAEAPTLPAPERVSECVNMLARLGVPLTAGRPAAQQALRDAGGKYSTEVIASAVRYRKLMAPADPDDEQYPVIVAS
jgi:hypothetical protein